MQNRYILRYNRKGGIPSIDVGLVARLPDVSIIEKSVKMLLVEGPESGLREFVATNPEWMLFQERTYSVPDSRYKVKNHFSPEAMG